MHFKKYKKTIFSTLKCLFYLLEKWALKSSKHNFMMMINVNSLKFLHFLKLPLLFAQGASVIFMKIS